jgi:hypothetical protein
MIDELVRDALDTQVGTPPTAVEWERIDRAAGFARQRRRRARVVLAVGASVTALLVAALTWPSLAGDGQGIQVATATTERAPSGGPAPAANVRTLDPAPSTSPQSGYVPTTRSFVAARASEAGLVVFTATGAMCDAPSGFRVSSTSSEVEVSLVGSEPPGCIGGIALGSPYFVALPSPLGGRRVVDGSTGKAVHLLDASALLVPRELPTGWVAETEQLSDKGTWSRCYGRCSTSNGPEVTTAEGPDLADVLHNGLGQIDDVIPENLTYYGQPLSKRPFAYGGSSELHGQRIPAADRTAVDVNGHDGVQLASWANLIVVWQDGTTWHAVATSRDRRTTDGAVVGIGVDKLVAFARSLAPAA